MHYLNNPNYQREMLMILRRVNSHIVYPAIVGGTGLWLYGNWKENLSEEDRKKIFNRIHIGSNMLQIFPIGSYFLTIKNIGRYPFMGPYGSPSGFLDEFFGSYLQPPLNEKVRVPQNQTILNSLKGVLFFSKLPIATSIGLGFLSYYAYNERNK